MKSRKNKIVKVIDLFCGIGGMTHGFVNEGFEVVAGIDNDPTCEYGYVRNNDATFVCKDIASVTGKELNEMYGACDVRVLIGCAPCQPFSHLNPTSIRKEKLAPLQKFAQLIKDIKPEIVSMENVKGLIDRGGDTVFKEFIEALNKNGYQVSYRVVDTSDYGVPQKRMRLVLLASRLGEIRLIAPTHTEKGKRTVRDVISDLEPLKDGEVSTHDPLHRARKLSSLNKMRIRATSKDGGSSSEWSEKLKLECHKKPSGKTYGSVYGRMRWDDVAPTITGGCHNPSKGRFLHPCQNRTITLREAALLQGFPADYKFDLSHGKEAIALMIGNALPPPFISAHARTLMGRPLP